MKAKNIFYFCFFYLMLLALLDFCIYKINVASVSSTESPVKLRIMQYNIGKFSYGISGGLSEDVEAKIDNYKFFLGAYQPDIVAMQEYPKEEPEDGGQGYIDEAQKYDPDDTIFNSLYPYTSDPYFETILKSNMFPYITEYINLDIQDAANRSKGVLCVYDINGKTLGVISCYFNIMAPRESRLKQLQDAIEKLQEYDYAIICTDCNATLQSEFDTMLSVAANAGYVASNGGYFGQLDTYGGYKTEDGFYCIDQIFCRNMIIKNVEIPKVYDSLSSDHYPLIVDVLLF